LKVFKKQKGITLTETIIYIAIIATVVVGIVSISMQLIQLKTRADSLSIISGEVTKFFEKIIYDFRSCDDFEVVDETTLDITTDGVTIRYYLQDSRIYVNEDGSNYGLTSNLARISNLEFVDWTSVNSDNLIHIEIEFERGGINEQFQTSIHQR
jgi:type II secretory pathway pseudopilin PulG